MFECPGRQDKRKLVADETSDAEDETDEQIEVQLKPGAEKRRLLQAEAAKKAEVVLEVGCGGGLQHFYLTVKPLQLKAHFGKKWHLLNLQTGQWEDA